MASETSWEHLSRLAKSLFQVAQAFIAPAARDDPWHLTTPGSACLIAHRIAIVDAHAAPGGELVVLQDTTTTTPGPLLRFFAGCPLFDRDGNKLGTLCLFDAAPREFGDEARRQLQDLARAAATQLEHELDVERLAALGAHERRMALAITGSDTGIWDRNVVTGEIIYSPGWKAILGYGPDELTSFIEDSYTRLHPDDREYVKRSMQEHFDGKTASYSVDHRIRCKDGSYKWICSRGKVVERDADGRALRMIGTTTDITALRSLSDALQQSVDLITNLTNEVPGLVFQQRLMPDGTCHLTHISAGFADIYGFTPCGTCVDDADIQRVIAPEDLALYRASLAASAAGLTPWHLEYRVDLPDAGQQWRQGDARPQQLEDGSVIWHGVITNITERKRIEAELQGFATIDFLTQVANRRHFMVRIGEELSRLKRAASGSAAVLMFDLDHFKTINDSWGHAVGDRALKHFSAILRAELRKNDVVGRVGGEEFAVLLSGADAERAHMFAERVRRRMRDVPLMEGSDVVAMTVSVGIAALHASDSSVDAAISASDVALYRAKQEGRDRVVAMHPQDEPVRMFT